VLLALALEALPPARREELLSLVSGTDAVDSERVSRVRYLYDLAGVFEKAERLVDKFRAKAEDLADAAAPPDLRDLLLYLVDSVLDGSSHVVPEAPAESSGGLVSLPVA
jgi:geranylgeranyl pyrophosphate synthase